jgi:hypothetical protein
LPKPVECKDMAASCQPNKYAYRPCPDSTTVWPWSEAVLICS